MRRIIGLGILIAVLCGLMIATPAVPQSVTPQTQTLPVQINYPGNPYTLQSAFCQTSTGGAQANTITVAALAGKSIYVTGFEITGDGATAQSVVAVTLAFGGTTVANYSVNIPAGATTSITPLTVEPATPIVSPTIGTNCVLTVGTFGAGNTAASVTLHGYYQ